MVVETAARGRVADRVVAKAAAEAAVVTVQLRLQRLRQLRPLHRFRRLRQLRLSPIGCFMLKRTAKTVPARP